MEVKIENPEKGKKEISVHVNTDELVPKFEEAYRDYKKNIVLGGFRKGKVPLHLVKQMFGKSIRRDVADKQISEYSEQIITEHKIHIVAPPEIDDVDFNETDGLKFKINLEVQPEFDLTKYTGFKFEKENYSLDDETIQKTLEQIQDQHAQMEPIETEAKANDFVIADLQQLDETGVPIIGKKYDAAFFHLNENDKENYVVSKQFLGVKNGDVIRITVPKMAVDAKTEPTGEDFYEATVKEVKTKILPELDDEFAKDLGDYETFDEFKESVVKRLEKKIKQEAHQHYINNISNEVVEANPFDLAEKLVQMQVKSYVERFLKQRPSQPINPDMLMEQFKKEADWNLRWDLLKDKIIEKENFELTDKDYDDYYAEIAEMEDTDVERIRNRYLNEDLKKQIEPSLMEKKIINFVAENSKITEKTIPYSEHMASHDHDHEDDAEGENK